MKNNRSMPLLNSCVSSTAKKSGIAILHINHCMDNSFYFNNELLKVFDSLVFIGVPYSNKIIPNEENYTSYSAVGDQNKYTILKNNNSVLEMDFDIKQVMDKIIELAIINDLLPLIDKGYKLMVFEDGGYHYKTIDRLRKTYKQLDNAIIGAIEQTMSGALSSTKIEKNYPTLSVCRSDYKVRIEAYFVAGRIIDSTIKVLRDIDKFLDFKKVLILGYGIIGRSLAKRLTAFTTDINVYDTNQTMLSCAKNDGFKTENFECSNEMIIFGNVGKPSIDMDSFMKILANPKLKIIYLVSSSSKRIEFSLLQDYLDSLNKTSREFSTIYTNENGKKIVLLAHGYPINFCDKNEESLTYSMIDVVFAEMFLLAKLLTEDCVNKDKKLLLLGVDNISDKICENQLIQQWGQINGIDSNISNINIHPCEWLLRGVHK